MPKHMHGGKVARRHSTTTDYAQTVAKAAEKMPEVRRVKLGRIKRAPGGKLGIKCTVVNRELLRVSVRSSGSVQEINLGVDNAERVKGKLEVQFPSR